MYDRIIDPFLHEFIPFLASSLNSLNFLMD